MAATPDPPAEICAIGLDVGGTKIAAGLVLFSPDLAAKKVLARSVIPTKPERGGEAVLADALGLGRNMIAAAQVRELKVGGIGVDVCELVDRDGNVTSSHQVAWQGLPIRETFSRLAPAIIESDVRTPAFAEAYLGAGRPYRLFVYVTVGTGISSCLVQDREPYAGTRGGALVLASSPLTIRCTHCGDVSRPILEEIASGPALVKRANQAVAAQNGNGASVPSYQRGQDVLAAAAEGDRLASEVVNSGGQALGVSVGWLVNVLDPEAVIVGGGLGTAGGVYWDSFVETTRAHIWSEAARGLPILNAALGVDAGFIGAAAMAAKPALLGEGRVT